jgi:hypothetical protein
MYTLDIDLGKSNMVFAILTVGHLFAAVSLFMIFSNWHVSWQALLLTVSLILYSYYYNITHYALLTRQKAWVKLRWDLLSACWWLQNRRQQLFQARLLPDSIITTGFLLLNFKVERQFFAAVVLITTDNVHKDNLRKCRVIINNGYTTKKNRSAVGQACQER